MIAKLFSYDPICLEVGTHFLKDEPDLDTQDNRNSLAQTIQMAVEQWFNDKKRSE